MRGLVLSLFPGADLWGMAFEAEGFYVVRGPDILLGGDVRKWHAIPGKFDGIIGGPPCKSFSKACKGQVATEGNLIPEFERIVKESVANWWVMENVPQAPVPEGAMWSGVYDAWWFGSEQHRSRRFSSNLALNPVLLEPSERHPDPFPCVTATECKYNGSPRDRRRAGRKLGRQLTLLEMNRLMGLPEDFETPALLMEKAYAVRGNGVPLQMGRALARAVINNFYQQ